MLAGDLCLVRHDSSAAFTLKCGTRVAADNGKPRVFFYCHQEGDNVFLQQVVTHETFRVSEPEVIALTKRREDTSFPGSEPLVPDEGAEVEQSGERPVPETE
jgi:hypothetical protein